MHDAKRYLPRVPDRDRALLLFKRAIQAQAIAGHCIDVFLSKPPLWPLFAEDVAMEQFWLADPAEQRRRWGPELDLNQCLMKMREDLVDDDVLGL